MSLCVSVKTNPLTFAKDNELELQYGASVDRNKNQMPQQFISNMLYMWSELNSLQADNRMVYFIMPFYKGDL